MIGCQLFNQKLGAATSTISIIRNTQFTMATMTTAMTTTMEVVVVVAVGAAAVV